MARLDQKTTVEKELKFLPYVQVNKPMASLQTPRGFWDDGSVFNNVSKPTAGKVIEFGIQ